MRFWICMAAVLILDQWSKWLVATNLYPGQSIEVWPGVMWLTHVFNRGAAFSMLQGQTVFFIMAALIVALLLIGYNIVAKPLPMLQVITGIMAGGALGNLLDRYRYGHVVDYIDFHFFPVFNLADMAITIGGTLLVVYFIWFDKEGILHE